MKRYWTSLVSLAWLAACGPTPPPLAPEAIFVNGKIALVDDAFTLVQALAVRDGKVAAVGTTSEISALKGEKTRVIDLKGKTVLPGFIDSHLHVRSDPPRSIDLSDCRSLTDLKEKVKKKAQELGPGQWITGWGWAEDDFAEKGHSSVANALALKLSGIGRATPDPPGGLIDKDAPGEPTGWIRERAQVLVTSKVPDPTGDETRQALLGNLKNLLKLGLTSFIDAGVSLENLPRFQDIYGEQGSRLPRATLQVRLPRDQSVDQMIAALRALPFHTGFGNDRLKIGAIKLSVDGGYTGAAAYTLQPYKGKPGFYGTLFLKEDDLARLVREAHARGWQLGVHTIGDGAVQVAVGAFEKVLKETPRPNHRHYVNHLSVKPPEATLKRLAELGMLVAQQPCFTYTLEGPYNEFLEGERLETNNPVASLKKLGIHVALGNDNLPIGPLYSLYAAVTRKGKSGRVYGSGESVSIEEAIRGYTRDSAYVSFDEAVKGTLEPGKLADLVVLSEDILSIDPSRILDIAIVATIVGGEVLWSAEEASPATEP
jgi:predicted amidohydrolase YtcJ